MNTNYLMKKKNFHLFYSVSLNCVVFSFKIYFSFSFCSDFNLEAIVIKKDKIRGLKQFLLLFSLNWKNIFLPK